MTIDGKMRRGRLVTAGLIGVLGWTALAAGQDAVTNRRPPAPPRSSTSIEDEFPGAEQAQMIPVRDELVALVRRLDAAAYADRVEATQRLLDEPWDRDQLYALLARDELSPEQRHRLLGVVRHRLLHRPRGAVGIEVDQLRMRDNEIVIKNFVRGLPAEQALQIGDRITHLNGTDLRDWNEFRNAVQGRTPGERIRLRVERLPRDERGELILDGRGEPKVERLNIDLELGSAALLQQGAVPQVFDSRDMARAQTAMDLYRPATRAVPLETGAAIDGRPTFISSHGSASIEQHPAVLGLRRQLRLIQDGELALTNDLKERWQRTLDRLFNEANRPGITDDHRRYRLMVAQRYRDLLP